MTMHRGNVASSCVSRVEPQREVWKINAEGSRQSNPLNCARDSGDVLQDSRESGGMEVNVSSKKGSVNRRSPAKFHQTTGEFSSSLIATGNHRQRDVNPSLDTSSLLMMFISISCGINGWPPAAGYQDILFRLFFILIAGDQLKILIGQGIILSDINGHEIFHHELTDAAPKTFG